MSIENIKTVTVVGAGTMGPGMAATFARYGFETYLSDIKDEQIEKAKGTIDFVFKTLVGGGFLTAEEAEAAKGRITLTTNQAEAVGNADFVVETVPERLEIKKAVFRGAIASRASRGRSSPPILLVSPSLPCRRGSASRTAWSACTGRTRPI